VRTSLDINLDILKAAKEMAVRTKRTCGQVPSDLARNSLVGNKSPRNASPAMVNGFEILLAEDRVVIPELVQKLMEESDLP
jgi:hypothetical protein